MLKIKSKNQTDKKIKENTICPKGIKYIQKYNHYNNTYIYKIILKPFFIFILIMIFIVFFCQIIVSCKPIKVTNGSNSINNSQETKITNQENSSNQNNDSNSEKTFNSSTETSSKESYAEDSIDKEKNETTTSNEFSSNKTEDENKNYNDFNQEKFLSEFNKLLENNPPEIILKYIEDNYKNCSPKTLAFMLEGLEKAQKKYQEKYMWSLLESNKQEILINTFTNEEEFTIDNINKIKDYSLRNEIEKIFKGGYKFVNLEGSYYPIIDFGYFKKFTQFLDKEYNDYLNIRATESNTIYSRDAGLMISWDELAQRMINAQNYLSNYEEKDYPDISFRRDEIARLFVGYFTAYLYGQNNTPTRDYNTNKVYEDVIKSYNKTMVNYPEIKAVKILKDYFVVLEKNNFILSNEILNSIDQYINRLYEEYNIDPEKILY